MVRSGGLRIGDEFQAEFLGAQRQLAHDSLPGKRGRSGNGAMVEFSGPVRLELTSYRGAIGLLRRNSLVRTKPQAAWIGDLQAHQATSAIPCCGQDRHAAGDRRVRLAGHLSN